jgi:membrane-bound lytic murein transglycosylase A
VSFNDLAGWSQEDHLGALDAFRQGCGVAKDPAMAEVCRKARAERPGNDDDARRFLESHFRPEAVPGQGLLTAYFAPEYEARMSRSAEFSAPMRGKPADLVTVDLAQFEPGLVGKKVAGEIEGGQVRALSRSRGHRGHAGDPSPGLDASGGPVLPADPGLGHPGPARRPPGARGVRGPQRPAVRRHRHADARPRPAARQQHLRRRHPHLAGRSSRPEADAIMQLNPRYVFFQTLPDDGRQAVGAAGIPLPAGRAIAVDASKHALGELFWLDASAPKLAGAFPAYRRLAVALDVGGAIKGDVRADLYTGTGPAAGAEAGRVRHELRLYRLVPRG